MRAGTFRAAADHLNVTPAAVSSQIRSLEQRLGRRLFHRAAGHAEPTADARRLYPDISRAFEGIVEATERIAGEVESGLNISLLPSFLQLWLLPRLPEFQKRHPALELRFSASQQVVDLTRGDFHAAIRFGRGNYPGLERVKLLDDWLLPVCAPELLQRESPLSTFGELQRYPLLHSEHDPWSDWLRRLGGDTTRPLQGVSLDDGGSLLQGVRAGQGIALMRWSLVASELEAGRLMQAMDALLPMDESYWYVQAPGVRHPHLPLFRSWLTQQAKEFAPPPTTGGGR